MNRIETGTSFWLHPDGNIVRILYNSPVSWENTMMADIDFKTEDVKSFFSHEANRHQIAKFNLEIDGDCGSYRKLSLIGNDLTLIKEAKGVIEKQGNECRLLKIHIDASLEYDYIYTNASYWQLDEIRKQITDVYLSEADGIPKNAFFCGTTDDIDIKMEWHRMHDFEIADDKVFAWGCATVQNATIVKRWAVEEGYDTQGDVIPAIEKPQRAAIVYLLKKGKMNKR